MGKVMEGVEREPGALRLGAGIGRRAYWIDFRGFFQHHCQVYGVLTPYVWTRTKHSPKEKGEKNVASYC